VNGQHTQDWLRWDTLIFFGGTVAAAVWIGYHIRDLGFRIEQPAIGLDYAMGVLWWIVLAVGLIWLGGEDRKLLLAAWLAKFFVVLVVMLFYEQRYGLDAYHYFRATVTGIHFMYPGIDWREEWYHLFRDPTRGLQEHRLGQGTDNMLRLVMLISLIAGKYYHALKIVFAFFGLMGAYAFYRAVVVMLGRPAPIAFYWLAFFPSILFWSSILGKDPLIFMILGIVAYGAARLLVRGEAKGFFIASGGFVLAFNVRPWTAVMAAGCLVLAVLIRRGHVIQRLAIVVLALPALLYAWEPIAKRFHIEDLKSVERLYVQLTEGQDVRSEWTAYTAEFGGSRRANEAMELAQQMQSGNLGQALPVVIFSGLFRPLPFDARNIFSGLAAVENTILLVLVLVALRRLKWSTVRDPVVIWAASYCVLWSALHGAILLANFGAGVRYKLQMVPFMIMVLFLLLHREGYAKGMVGANRVGAPGAVLPQRSLGAQAT
jgi:hypothetical protein